VYLYVRALNRPYTLTTPYTWFTAPAERSQSVRQSGSTDVGDNLLYAGEVDLHPGVTDNRRRQDGSSVASVERLAENAGLESKGTSLKFHIITYKRPQLEVWASTSVTVEMHLSVATAIANCWCTKCHSPVINLLLTQITSWMTSNLLSLNSSKTEFLLIGFSRQLAKIHNPSVMNKSQINFIEMSNFWKCSVYIITIESRKNHNRFAYANNCQF